MQEKAFLWGCVVEATPELVVDVRTVEQCSHYILVGTHVSKNQTDPVQRCQQEENKCQKEIPVIGLPHTAVDPNTNKMTNKTPNWALEIIFTYQLHRVKRMQRVRSPHCLHYTYVYMKNKTFYSCAEHHKVWLMH